MKTDIEWDGNDAAGSKRSGEGGVEWEEEEGGKRKRKIDATRKRLYGQAGR